MKKMLFISSFFPNPSAPNIATYVRQSLLALSEHYHIDALVPVPWLCRLKGTAPPRAGSLGPITVRYPSYFYTPLVLRSLYGAFYHRSIVNTVKEIASTHYDFVHSAWLYPDAWVAAKVAEDRNLPLFVYVLGTDVNRLRPGHFLTTRMLEVASYAKKIVCVSNPLREKLARLGCDPEKLVYLQNGIDHTIFHPIDRAAVRAELGIDAADRIILYVGNLKKEKGLGELAESFSQIVASREYPGIRLVVIGNGRYRWRLAGKLRRLGVEGRATLLGERSPGDIARFMNACDLLCLPSYMEGEPNVVIEALACGAKVVATKVGGTPDLDRGDGTMLLVEPRSVQALTSALGEMLGREIAPSQQLAARSWQSHALQMKQIFEASFGE
jgi:teichuronic acid biosynthesis glycosyltransferase TuaC